jgi:hypothetical protein
VCFVFPQAEATDSDEMERSRQQLEEQLSKVEELKADRERIESELRGKVGYCAWQRFAPRAADVGYCLDIGLAASCLDAYVSFHAVSTCTGDTR